MAIKREVAEDLYDTFENLYKQSLEGQSIDLELINLGRLKAKAIPQGSNCNPDFPPDGIEL